jgi:GMP synthase (glutamine-hydrolysing)
MSTYIIWFKISDILIEMKVLIIDNESKHIPEIISSCIAYLGVSPEVSPWSDVTYEYSTQFHKIVISGSSTFSVRTYPEVYAAQREILDKSTCPLLGICAGFELICTYFESTLVRNDARIQGIHQITITSSDILTTGFKNMSVYEGHRLACETVNPPLLELARSESGVEIVKHITRRIYGVQFHPEVSKPVNDGTILLKRFFTLI